MTRLNFSLKNLHIEIWLCILQFMFRIPANFQTLYSRRKFNHKIRRNEKRETLWQKYLHHCDAIRKNALRLGQNYTLPRFQAYKKTFTNNVPVYSETLNFLAKEIDLISKNRCPRIVNGIHKMPKCFSLIEHYEQSFDFLKTLFLDLHKGWSKQIIIDYSSCKRIDVDASIFMDIILADYISYLNECDKNGVTHTLKGIKPINISKDIEKILFSIGAFRNIKGYIKSFPDVIPLPVKIGDKKSRNSPKVCEVHITQIVDYIKACLERMKRDLTWEAENSIYKVLGEVMTNAEDHGTLSKRYAIGYFQTDTDKNNEAFGVFNFTIFNFGDTIYQTFQNVNCPVKVKGQMEDLSKEYTKRSLFRAALFQEETLWTLYALQEGVTSKPTKRGTGTIKFLENFFNLKGNSIKDNLSKLVLMSGNTRITFDGSYQIIEKFNQNDRNYKKMITFHYCPR